jgi:putative intracellular protease/amidase
MTSVLMVLTSHDRLGDTARSTGWNLPEAAHPWKVFSDAGYKTSFVSPQGGRPSMDGVDLDDPIQSAFLEAFGSEGPETTTPGLVDASLFDIVFFVGGHGTMWDFADHHKLAELTASVYDADGVVAAVCHGPAGLVNVRLEDGSYLVTGKKLTAFTNSEEEAVGLTKIVPFSLQTTLTERGAIHQAAANFEVNVVVDGRLVTGQNPASATGVGEAIVAAIGGLVAA